MSRPPNSFKIKDELGAIWRVCSKQREAFVLPAFSRGRIARSLGVVASLLFGRAALADLTGSLVFTTNYIYRGYSKSNDNPVGQGNLEYAHESGVYGGLWVSQVNFGDHDFPDSTRVELNPYLGWVHSLSEDWRGEVSVGGYIYPGKISGVDSSYAEYYLSLHYSDFLTARWAFAPNAFNRDATTFAYELMGRYSFLDTLQGSLGVGFNQAYELLYSNYPYWTVGLTWYPWNFLALDLRYIGTALKSDSHQGHDHYFAPGTLDTPRPVHPDDRVLVLIIFGEA
jgi:uncharacterized protein (TIGR02001 family)